MAQIRRRQFLQFAGATLAAMGLNQLQLQQQGWHYARALAQGRPGRKLALLVGINQYAQRDRIGNLYGCVNDARLQRELLVHRFGFNPSDIVTLTDGQATRQGILTAFEDHLIAQAQPGDIVVFHFSGHGSRVQDPNPIHESELNSTLLPSDASWLESKRQVVNDIMGRTLFLLTAALRTENVVVVLDSCYAGGGTRGSFRVRAAAGGTGWQPDPADLEYQERWLSRLNLSRQQFEQRRQQGIAKGISLAAAQPHQLALDGSFAGFSAGAFTYLLARLLWQQVDTAEGAIATISREIEQFSVQVPLVERAVGRSRDRDPIYFVPSQTPPAEGVVTSVQGREAQLWLGGVSREILKAFGSGSRFHILNAAGNRLGEATLQSRQGLRGTATVAGKATVGSVLQETARAIPADIALHIGLDPSLTPAEIAAAQRLIRPLDRIEAVPSRAGMVPYATEVQYILGRMTRTDRQQLRRSADRPVAGSLGLFSPAKTEWLASSFGPTDESIEAAIGRLTAKLKSLLAARLVKLILNADASALKLEAEMRLEAQSKTLIGEAFTVRSGIERQRSSSLPPSRQLPLNSPFQFSLRNRENIPLYVSILVLAPSSEIILLFPNRWGASEDVAQLPAQQTLQIPDPQQDPFQFVTQEQGIGEALIIASSKPLREALQTLQTLAEEQQLPRDSRGDWRGPLVPTVRAIDRLLNDLSETRGGLGPEAKRTIETATVAALSITFEVI